MIVINTQKAGSRYIKKPVVDTSKAGSRYIKKPAVDTLAVKLKLAFESEK